MLHTAHRADCSWAVKGTNDVEIQPYAYNEVLGVGVAASNIVALLRPRPGWLPCGVYHRIPAAYQT